MRLPSTAHTTRPWRIHAVAPDFRVEDVWALPTPGGADDFPLLVQRATSLEPEHGAAGLGQLLWAIRWKVGALLGWDDEDADRPSLRDRVPADLRGTAPAPGSAAFPFTPLYVCDDEYAAEIANATMHGVLHLSWVPDGDRYRGQMAVLVKPNGVLGRLYMAAIKPFRYAIVYPQLLRRVERDWQAAT